MADPQPYDVSYSFAGFQVNNPATPLPATKLDNELLDIETSIASIVAAIKDVRRADGVLQNGLVHFEALDLALQLMLDPTDATLVANAVAASQAGAVASAASSVEAAASAAAALVSQIAAAASAATVDLTAYLPKAGNLADLGSVETSRTNLGLGTAATLDAGAGADNIVQLDAGGKLPAYDGSQLTGIDTLPIGTTIYVNATAAPPGFVKENGAALLRTSYPRLWAFALASGNLVSEAAWTGGQTGGFSTGDNTTTFRVPDARGEFIRSYDDGRGNDIGRLIYVRQADTVISHTHSYNVSAAGSQKPNGTGTTPFDNLTSATSGIPSTGAAVETRPRNIAKLACIKAY